MTVEVVNHLFQFICMIALHKTVKRNYNPHLSIKGWLLPPNSLSSGEPKRKTK